MMPSKYLRDDEWWCDRRLDTRKGRILTHTHTHTKTALYYKLAQIGEAKFCLLRKNRRIQYYPTTEREKKQ